MPKDDVLYTKDNGIATITLNRPRARNAVSWEMHDLLDEALDDAAADDAVRVVILTGTDPSFCSGTDVRGGMAPSAESRLAELPKGTGERRLSWKFVDVAKPTIAAVNGAAVGMGVEFATQCDIRIASEKARFGWIFPQRGLIPDTGAGTYLLPRIVGLSKACELVFSGEIIDADEALRIGVVSKVVPHEQLMPAAREMALKFCKGAPLSLRWAKQLIYRGLERDLETHAAFTSQLLGMCFQTEDHQEGVKSFLEKREPVFKGR
ncbi:enoyl-CoA hydratase/isomerase family protein [Thermodesulfobacteriota bacterium]